MNVIEKAGRLRIGQMVSVRRTSGTVQPGAKVVTIASGREYMAPEVPSFRVEFRCAETGRLASRWCSALDLVSAEGA